MNSGLRSWTKYRGVNGWLFAVAILPFSIVANRRQKNSLPLVINADGRTMEKYSEGLGCV